MGPAMLAQFGMNFGSSYLQGMQNRSNIIAVNQQKKIANTENTKATASAIGELDAQKMFVRAQAAMSGQAAERVAESTQATATAQAAAAGVRGASVDAQQDVVDKELARAEYSILSNAIQAESNINKQVISLATQARLNLHSYAPVPSKSDIAKNAFIQAGTQSANSYFSFGG